MLISRLHVKELEESIKRDESIRKCKMVAEPLMSDVKS